MSSPVCDDLLLTANIRRQKAAVNSDSRWLDGRFRATRWGTGGSREGRHSLGR